MDSCPRLKPSVVRERPPAGSCLQIGAQLEHAVQRIQEELSDGVDLQQSQIVQLEKKMEGIKEFFVYVV